LLWFAFVPRRDALTPPPLTALPVKNISRAAP
jgi:hypothetical protein